MSRTPKEETVVEVLLRFLQNEEAGAPAPLISKRDGEGRVVLSSYGVPIAELKEGEVVVRMVGDKDMIPVRRKHRKWLEVIAQEKGVRGAYENEKGGD